MKIQFTLLISCLFFTGVQLISQELLRDKHHEVPDHEYVSVDKSVMPRQAGYSARFSDIITSQVNVDANGLDIIGDAGNEPSIAVDPTNPNRMVIGWRQFDTVTNNFRQAGYGYSLDGGLTWTFPGVINPGIFRSDPVLDFDAQGNFYYNSLQGTFECDVYQITDGGVAWSGPFPAKGGDKQWMRMDRTGGIGDQNNYSYWNSNFSTCEPGQFTRSADGSFTFEDCLMIDGDPFWGTLAVDKSGDLYITGAGNGGIILVKSTNAKDPNENIVWDFVTDVDLDGQLSGFFPLNPQGLIGQAWVDVDISNGAGENNVYVLASVVRNNDPADVMFARSTDGGASFEPPVRINTDALGGYNWFGTMSVAPNGRIDVVWLDTRDDPNNFNSRLYYSFSEDNGTTWANNEPLSPAFDSTVGWPQQNKMGDYFDMVSDNDYAYLAWANTLNGGQDVYFTRIAPEEIVIGTLERTLVDFSLAPNPIENDTQIQFQLQTEKNISVIVYDVLGKPVATLFEGAANGKMQIPWKGTAGQNSKLNSGMYFIAIAFDGYQKTLKAIVK
ncbi:MAG: T9SS type A sorting domain-containing protein [Flavobacteriaceae bacterium]